MKFLVVISFSLLFCSFVLGNSITNTTTDEDTIKLNFSNFSIVEEINTGSKHLLTEQKDLIVYDTFSVRREKKENGIEFVLTYNYTKIRTFAALSHSVVEKFEVMKPKLSLMSNTYQGLTILADESKDFITKKTNAPISSSILVLENSSERELKIDSNTLIDFIKKDYPDRVLPTEYITARKNIYDNNRKDENAMFLSFGLSFAPTIAYRINTFESTGSEGYQNIIDRHLTELYDYGSITQLRLLFRPGFRHHLYLCGSYSVGGFQSSDNSLIDWTSGYKIYSDYNQVNYRFKQLGWGLGYNYIGYNRENALTIYFDVSLNSLKIRNVDNTTNVTLTDDELVEYQKGLNTDQWMAAVAVGPAWRFTPETSLHFAPMFSYNFSSLNPWADIRTRLFQVGLQVGLTKQLAKVSGRKK